MKKNTKILLVLGLIVLAVLVFLNFQRSSHVKVEDEKAAENTVSPYLNSDIKVKTFQSEKGWGYDVTIDGALYVHQPSMPALPGDAGFKTEADAKKVGELVIQKIRDNILPPSVTPEEVNAVVSIKANQPNSGQVSNTEPVCNVGYEATSESKVAFEQSQTLITGFEKKCDGHYYLSFDYLGTGAENANSGGSSFTNTNFQLRMFKADSNLKVKLTNNTEVPISSYITTLKKVNSAVFNQANAYIRNAPDGQAVFSIVIQGGV